MNLGGSSGETATVTASSANIGTVAKVVLTVSSGDRSASTSVLVTTLGTATPVVAIARSAQNLANFNAFNRLSIIATVDLESAAAATWFLDGVVIDSSIALTNTSQIVQPSSVPTPVNLVLKANSLPTASTLVFTLQCGDGFSSVSVVTNSPPSSGSFTVTPLNGVEISTKFTLSAVNWIDSDLPLTYEFSVFRTAKQVIQTRSESSFALPDSGLPSGLDSGNFSISCLVSVYDSLLLSITESQDVRVVKSAVLASTLANFQTIIDNSVGSTQIDDSLSILAAGSVIINDISCLSAPDCAAIGRNDCSTTTNTCGSCLDGFIGSSGDSNVICVDPTSRDDVVFEEDGFCIENTQCPLWQVCDGSPVNLCREVIIECSRENQCSNQGVCVILNVNSGDTITECLVGDPTCSTSCLCDDTWYGSDCSVDADTHSEKSRIREELMAELLSLCNRQVPSLDVVQAWISSLGVLLQVESELTDAATDAAIEITNMILTSAASVGIPADQVVEVLASLDVLVQRATQSTSTGRRRLTDTTFDAVKSSLLAYTTSVMTSMAEGQSDIVEIQSQFRYSIRSQATSSGSVSLSTPVSAAEIVAGVTDVARADISVDSSYASSMVAGIVELKAIQFTGVNVTTNPLYVMVNDLMSCSSTGACTVELSINTLAAQTYVDNISTDEIIDSCERDGNVVVNTHSCPFGNSDLTTTCTGDSTYEITSTCDMNLVRPSCERIVGAALLDDVCSLVSYTTTSTVCSCTLQYSDFGRRRLAESGGSVQLTGAIDNTYIASTTAESSYAPTGIPSSAPTSVPVVTVWDEIVVELENNAILIGCGGAGLLILVAVYIWRHMELKEKAELSQARTNMMTSYTEYDMHEHDSVDEEEEVDIDDEADMDHIESCTLGDVQAEPTKKTGVSEMKLNNLAARVAELKKRNAVMRIAVNKPDPNPERTRQREEDMEELRSTKKSLLYNKLLAQERELTNERYLLVGLVKANYPGKEVDDVVRETAIMQRHRRMLPTDDDDDIRVGGQSTFAAARYKSPPKSQYDWEDMSSRPRSINAGMGARGQQISTTLRRGNAGGGARRQIGANRGEGSDMYSAGGAYMVDVDAVLAEYGEQQQTSEQDEGMPLVVSEAEVEVEVEAEEKLSAVEDVANKPPISTWEALGGSEAEGPNLPPQPPQVSFEVSFSDGATTLHHNDVSAVSSPPVAPKVVGKAAWGRLGKELGLIRTTEAGATPAASPVKAESWTALREEAKAKRSLKSLKSSSSSVTAALEALHSPMHKPLQPVQPSSATGNTTAPMDDAAGAVEGTAAVSTSSGLTEPDSSEASAKLRQSLRSIVATSKASERFRAKLEAHRRGGPSTPGTGGAAAAVTSTDAVIRRELSSPPSPLSASDGTNFRQRLQAHKEDSDSTVAKLNSRQQNR